MIRLSTRDVSDVSLVRARVTAGVERRNQTRDQSASIGRSAAPDGPDANRLQTRQGGPSNSGNRAGKGRELGDAATTAQFNL